MDEILVLYVFKLKVMRLFTKLLQIFAKVSFKLFRESFALLIRSFFPNENEPYGLPIIKTLVGIVEIVSK